MTILLPFRGKVGYVIESDELFDIYAKETGRELGVWQRTAYFNPTDNMYCYPQYREWLLNRQLALGKIVVGEDAGYPLVVEKENLLGGIPIQQMEDSR